MKRSIRYVYFGVRDPDCAGRAFGGLLLVIVCIGFLVSCGDVASEEPGWRLSSPEATKVREGIYGVDVELREDSCSGISLREIVRDNSNWPPKRTYVRVLDEPNDEHPPSAVLYGYDLRTARELLLDTELRPGAEFVGSRFAERTFPIDEIRAAGECSSSDPGLMLPKRRLRAEAFVEAEGEFRVTVQTQWREFTKCADPDFTRKFYPWLPEEFPCRESYTFKYEFERSCGPYQRCRVINRSIPSRHSPNRGYDFTCECRGKGE